LVIRNIIAMLSDFRFWLLFIVFLVLAFGIQHILFIISDKKDNNAKDEKGGIN